MHDAVMNHANHRITLPSSWLPSMREKRNSRRCWFCNNVSKANRSYTRWFCKICRPASGLSYAPDKLKIANHTPNTPIHQDQVTECHFVTDRLSNSTAVLRIQKFRTLFLENDEGDECLHLKFYHRSQLRPVMDGAGTEYRCFGEIQNHWFIRVIDGSIRLIAHTVHRIVT